MGYKKVFRNIKRIDLRITALSMEKQINIEVSYIFSKETKSVVRYKFLKRSDFNVKQSLRINN